MRSVPRRARVLSVGRRPCSGPWSRPPARHPPASLTRAQGPSTPPGRCETWWSRPCGLLYVNRDSDGTCLLGAARIRGLLPPPFGTVPVRQMLALLPSPSRTLCRSSATCWPRRIGTSGRRRSWYACPPGVLRASPRLPTPQAGSGRALGFKSQMGLSQEVTQPSEPQCPRPSDDRPTARGSGRGLRKRVGRRVRAGTWQSLLIWRDWSASPQH